MSWNSGSLSVEGWSESGCVLSFAWTVRVCESLDIYNAHFTQYFRLRAGTRQVTSYSHFILRSPSPSSELNSHALRRLFVSSTSTGVFTGLLVCAVSVYVSLLRGCGIVRPGCDAQTEVWLVVRQVYGTVDDD